MSTFVVEPMSVDAAGVVEVLARAVGGNDVRLARVRECYRGGSVGLAGVFVDGSVVGVVGYRVVSGGRPCRIELLHIATHQRWERRGVGAAMVEWVRAEHSGDLIVAETDADAVAFYRALGFEVASLGELYPGVERFRVVLQRTW